MTHSEFLALRRFPALDGLRAVAALLVVVFHYGQPTWAGLTGWIGVHVFFVLSGFLITTLLLREESDRGRPSLWRFYVRRTARILPVYYVTLGLVAVLYSARGEFTGSGLSEDMPYYLSFTGELVGPGEPHGQVWTLGIEQAFYLVWPLLAFGVALSARRRAVVVVVALSATGAAAAASGTWVHFVPILLGCLLAVVTHSARGWSLVRRVTGPVVATVVAIAFLALHAALPALAALLGGDERPLIVGYALGVVVLLASLLAGRGPASHLLGSRPLVAVGERSYGLYLVQGIAGITVAEVVPALERHPTLMAAAVFTTALIMADLLYRWVEQPGIALGRRLARRRPTSSATPLRPAPGVVRAAS